MLDSDNSDNRVRWSPGMRLDHLFERQCDRLAAANEANRVAVVASDATLTFRELDERANRLARHLTASGIGSGHRVGILFDRSADIYVALLAVLKINAAYVPLDPGFPRERLAFIARDAGFRALLTHSALVDRIADIPVETFALDVLSSRIARLSGARLGATDRTAPTDALCYIIYTSGTTGQPKGVAIEHASICNFVEVAAETYGYRPGDRVFQGMTIAFDFSVEELWVPLIAGATLVQAPPGAALVGDDLAGFLRAHRVTALCCVPTLLATIEDDLPDVRLLLVSGEACPQGLVNRWHHDQRVLLNAYGPTEATVTATVKRLRPGEAVNIGVPLPTYSIVILDENETREVPDGAVGEIGIAGIGLAAGYLNRPELTAQKFIADTLGMPANPSGRIYRTGDLGRITPDGEIEYLGRIDTQVKIRGYRIELGEIESVLLEWPEVAQAVVAPWQPDGRTAELVAYCSLGHGVAALSSRDLMARLRERLPAYMVPAYIEVLPTIPMTSSHKADRKRLPPPRGTRLALVSSTHVPPTNQVETMLAAELAKILSLERISIDDHFFNDLGAHSLIMARYCARARNALGLPGISMRDIYLNPTVRQLASQISDRQRAASDNSNAESAEEMHLPSRFEHVRCGLLQVLYYAVATLLGTWVLYACGGWIFESGQTPASVFMRSVACAAAIMAGWTALAVAGKWLLVGAWRERSIPIWSLDYFRFWVVKGLVRSAPPVMFKGLPLYNAYLRMLGATIGEGAVVLCPPPVATDLFSVGSKSIIRHGALLPGYSAQNNTIHIGPIRIGDGAYVGSQSVLDIHTSMADGAQLGHASALVRGQRLERLERAHGVPAIKTESDFCPLDDHACTSLRRHLYGAWSLGWALLGVPSLVTLAYVWWLDVLQYAGIALDGSQATPTRLIDDAPALALLTSVTYVVVLIAGLLLVAIIPSLAGRMLEEDRTYVIFGWHYWLQRLVTRFSNWPWFNVLFGDSAYITGYVKWIGCRLARVVQTGANFGLKQSFDNPYLTEFGTGTMVSDGLAVANLEMSATAFRLRRIRIGAQSYLGNEIVVPAGACVGDNVLLATKVMVPIDGKCRQDVGLLGSPCFEIPRASRQDRALSLGLAEPDRRRGMKRKLIWNTWTIGALVARDLLVLYQAALVAHVAAHAHGSYGFAAIAGGVFVAAIVAGLIFVLAELSSLRFGSLVPLLETLYHPRFLRHERHWKLSSHPVTALFDGTPLKPLVYALLGVRMGRMVFMDGARIYDKSLVVVGDYANLNPGCVVQGHSLEEGVFKSDHVVVSNRCALLAGAFVHYGAVIGAGATLGPNAFLMKGEQVPAGATWGGNPAREETSEVAREVVRETSEVREEMVDHVKQAA